MSVLSERRKAMNLTQNQLAELIIHADGSKISGQTVSNWENFQRTPNPYEMRQAAKVLNYPIEELFKEFFLGKAK